MPFACELESGGLVFIETKEAAGQTEIFTSDKGIKYVRGETKKLVPYDPEITFEADGDLGDAGLGIGFTPDDGFVTVIDEEEGEAELSESPDASADEPLIWEEAPEEADGGEVYEGQRDGDGLDHEGEVVGGDFPEAA